MKYYFKWTSGPDYEYFNKCNINSILKDPIELLSKDDAFNRKLPLLNVPKEISSITYTDIPFENNKNIYITGNRQSEKYFSKEFARNMFTFTDIDKEVKRLYGKLSDTAAIHIRRTDYMDSNK